jgi:catechol 2,3-dioxygenase-like lactoylglutathione lyase family enzyme
MTEGDPRSPAAAKATGADSVPAPRLASLNHPIILSHGTLECRNLAASRRFYEEFLGLECVRHSKRSLKIRRGGYWCIVCLERGDHVQPLRIGNHWGLDLDSRDAVQRAHALATEYKDKYGIQKITKVTDDTDTYQFYFMDLDGNWWEFQYAGEGQRDGHGRNDVHFDRGDVVPM